MQEDYDHKSRLTSDEEKDQSIKIGSRLSDIIFRDQMALLSIQINDVLLFQNEKKKRNYIEELKFSLKFHYDTEDSNMAIDFDDEIIFYNSM